MVSPSWISFGERNQVLSIVRIIPHVPRDFFAIHLRSALVGTLMDILW